MPTSRPQVEYVAHSRIGEKGQVTIPKPYRDELGLETGAPVAVLRIGEGLMLTNPEQNRFRTLCESIESVLGARKLAPADLLSTLPAARRSVFLRRYPELAESPQGETRPSRRR
jgi:AbrB family looped-hinge helix DNA binding protein